MTGALVRRLSSGVVVAVAATGLVLGGCGSNASPDAGPDTSPGGTTDGAGPSDEETLGDGEIPEGEPTAATTAVELCEPDVDGDTIDDRSDFALVACDAPEGTTLSIVHVTPPAGQDATVQARSSADTDETPRVTLQARGLWPDPGTGVTTIDGDQATFAYTLFWYPEGASTDDRVEQDFTDGVTTGDTITHGPLTYEVLAVTDTGEPETSHLDLAVTFNPSKRLE